MKAMCGCTGNWRKKRIPMHEHSLKILEFEKIREELVEYCIGREGQDYVKSQPFLFDPGALDLLHRYVDESVRYLQREELPSLDFPRLSELIHRLRARGLMLEGEEIYSFARFILSAKELKKYLLGSEEYGFELLPALGREIADLGDTARKITTVLKPDGTVRDDHPALKGLRRRLAGLRSELSRLAQDYIQGSRDRWQSDVPTQRDGRLVLPMKSSYRSMVEGVIHYSSARGSTVYIEPPDIMAKNNDIALVEEEIRELILAILRDLTSKLREVRGELEALTLTVAGIDAYLCRARYALRNRCTRAVARERGFMLKQARHPLLKEKAVPIDIGTGEDIRALIISGPNAGGKTVTLKTVGLLVLMNQFGLQIPAAEGSELAVFNGVFGDIGDEQSIEGSLSTFSGHMQIISEILAHADDRSLILLDELGSGTDPGEGATLAMAILDECIERGATVLATSHHSLMKNYGYTTAHVQNASMDFDDTTLAPNYRVIPGLPGESHALDIASRSGIPEEIVRKAREYFSHESGEVGRMIRELEKKQGELRRSEEELRARELQLKQQIREQDLEKLRLRQYEYQLRETGYAELKGFLHESRKELENLVSDLKKSAASDASLSREDTGKVRDFIEKIEEKTDSEEEGLARSHTAKQVPRDLEFRPGMKVFAEPGRRQGTILRREKKNHWLVEVGAMKISLAESDLSPADPGTDSGGGAGAPGFSYAYGEGTSPPRAAYILDLRGKRLDEALDALSRQIDNALLNGMKEFEVIHGKGEGILQTGVRRFLGDSPAVEDFSFSRPEMGGAGKTIVRLR
jgi:DNA mismatch repair protein MutS2